MAKTSEIQYALTYRKMGETITVKNFASVFDALDYCRTENIEEPVEIKRHETVEERMLNRSQILELLKRPE